MVAHTEGCSRSGGRPFALVWSPIPLISWLMPFIGHIGICSSTGRTYDFAGPFTVNEDALLFGRPTRYLPINPTQAMRASGRSGAALPTEDDPMGLGRLEGGAAEHDAAEGGQVFEVAKDTAIPMTFSTPELGPTGAGFEAAATTSRTGRSNAQGSHGSTRLGPDDGFSCCKSGLAGAGPGSTAAATAVYTWDHKLAFAATAYRLMNYNLMTSNCHCFVAHFLNQVGYRGGGWDMVNLAALMFIQGRYTSLAGLIYTWLPWLVVVSLGGYFGRLLFLYCYLAICTPLLAWFLFYTWCCWRDLSF
ncbi:hypothetical protein Vretimale_5186 [Volvox reticuliferus]|uniref:Uncharacterized protein n=1 Tax=Volvox reticuliferus TaxID=1737510 RepID=A0A8J4C3S8_9CHLO|nr:hypothetical protein Vretifemale_3718 [Volvox reticuliferus]GIM00397.1 hypothetical protein Vretimale_5186 [Volvox reticuliferus]